MELLFVLQGYSENLVSFSFFRYGYFDILVSFLQGYYEISVSFSFSEIVVVFFSFFSMDCKIW